jgi:hypothetical protein
MAELLIGFAAGIIVAAAILYRPYDMPDSKGDDDVRSA